MLRFLSIKRLAVIDAVEVEFDPGLNVLTGETGAGKSILVEAVGLLLGGRASGDLVRTGEETATIEAIFENGGQEIHVRREISAQGRSRAFINGDLATASALKDLSGQLIEIHGQHEHHTLLDAATHLQTLDAFGQLSSTVASTAAAFSAMRETADELARVRATLASRASRIELASFQSAELEQAALHAGEDEALAITRQVLVGAERIERLCAESYASLYENDGAILAALGAVWKRVAELAALDPQFQPYVESRDAIKSQLEDLALFLRRYADTIDASPERLQEVEGRLALIERLKRKYGPSLADVTRRRDALRQELSEMEQGDGRLRELEEQYAERRSAFLERAQALSTSRHRVAADFPRRIERALAELAMDRTTFEIRFAETLPEESWGVHGIDQIEFYVSTNAGEDVRPLARVVSGGELSRIMLAIKTLTVASRHGYLEGERLPSGAAPGLIFDEVDAGIGGRVADVVGRKLHTLGSAFQVLCITHLPQIAAYADSHFAIQKTVESGRTRTSVSRLKKEEARVEELSRMLGGASISNSVRASARELLQRRTQEMAAPTDSGKAKAKGERRKVPGER